MKKSKKLIMCLGAAGLLLQAGCTDKLQTAGKISSVFHVAGAIGLGLAVFIYLFKDKVRDFLRGKTNIKFFLTALALFLISRSVVLAQEINFQPAVDTFYSILLLFAGITAGACGFYGLTRVAWLLVNEDRSSGTALVMSIIGFVVATIAVGLLTR